MGSVVGTSRAVTQFRGRQVDLPECWELVRDHTQVHASCAGEEYAVRGVRHVRDLARLQSPSATVTGESDHHSSENTNSLVVRSLHSHGYGYEVLGTQSHLLGDSNADQAALTARVGHDRQGYCAGAFQEVKTQRFVIFALVGESEVDVRLRAGRAFRPLIAHVIVQMVSEGECA